MGILGLLTLIFITLKLIPDDHGHVIDWSWWWVLSPIWLPLVVVLVVVVLGGTVAHFGRKIR